MDWLIRNKEWIFSGIGIAFIGILFAVIKYFIQRNRGKISALPRQPSVLISTVPNSSPTPKGTPAEIGLQTISASKIFNAVRSVPLLQRRDIGKHYQGIKVKWTGTLGYMHREHLRENQVRIFFKPNDAPNDEVMFWVNFEDYKGLTLLNIGDPVEVEGEIEEAEGLIKLKDVKLWF